MITPTYVGDNDGTWHFMVSKSNDDAVFTTTTTNNMIETSNDLCAPPVSSARTYIVKVVNRSETNSNGTTLVKNGKEESIHGTNISKLILLIIEFKTKS